MDFSINPNSHYLKALFVIESCNSLAHLKVAKRCIDLYDSRGDYFKSFFETSDLKPIVAHTGHYDHQMAVWILRKKLNYKNI